MPPSKTSRQALAIAVLAALLIGIGLLAWVVVKWNSQGSSQQIVVVSKGNWGSYGNTVPLKTYTISGEVADEHGNPITGARVYCAQVLRNSHATLTDAHGQFSMAVSFAGSVPITAIARGYVPETQRLAAAAVSKPIRIVLSPGRPLIGRIVDGSGKPVFGATVRWRYWRDVYTMNLAIRSRSNRAGRFSLPGIPQDWSNYMITAGGYADMPLNLKPEARPQTIVLAPAGSPATRPTARLAATRPAGRRVMSPGQ